MKTRSGVQNGRSETACKRLRSVHVAAIVFFLAAALPLSAQEKQDSGVVRPGIDSGTIGFIASKRAGAKEVGLPWYPGARPHQDKSDDSPAFQLGLWGGAWGFKLVGLKLESNDTPEKIRPSTGRRWPIREGPELRRLDERSGPAGKDGFRR